MASQAFGWTKQCRECKRHKHTSQFHAQRTKPGQKPICHDCEKLVRLKK